MAAKAKSKFKLTGHVVARLFDSSGKLKQQQEINNLIVDDGRTYVRDLIKSKIDAGVVTAMNYFALGTSSNAPVAGDAALVAEIAASRETVTVVNSGFFAVILSNIWAAGVATNANIREVGIFDAAAAGNMMARAVFSADINKEPLDTLEVNWTITVG